MLYALLLQFNIYDSNSLMIMNIETLITSKHFILIATGIIHADQQRYGYKIVYSVIILNSFTRQTWNGASRNQRGAASIRSETLHVGFPSRHWRQTELHRSNVLSSAWWYAHHWCHDAVLQVRTFTTLFWTPFTCRHL